LPATHVPAHRSHAARPRALAAALGLAACLTAGGAAVTPVEATNWSRQIGAVRASQLYHESAMRSADLQLRSLKHAARDAHRKLKKSRRDLGQARARRNELRSSRRASQAQLSLARERERLEALATPPPTAAPPGAWLALGSEPLQTTPDGVEDAGPPPAAITSTFLDRPAGPEPAGATDRELAPSAGEASPGDGSVPAAPHLALPAPTLPTAAQPLVEAAHREVSSLESQVKQEKRVLAKVSRKVRRISHSHRAKVRAVASIRASTRYAVARRESAEAGLGNAILAMSSLAQRRIVKKTSVRPGQGSGFAWPTYGRITQGYGCTGYPLEPTRGSCRHFHDGVDIASYRGTPIRAAAVGVVSYIGWNPWDQHGRAFMIVVAHPGGYETLYGHVLPTRHVRVGQLVRRGEVIGYMGSTGRSTGVHLHLEFRRGRTTLSPLAFL